MNTLVLLSQADTQVIHQFARLQSMSEWWQWFALAVTSLAILAFVVFMYRKDSVELPRGVAWGMTVLRSAAFAGVLFYFLDLEKREERRLVRASRVMVLADTSLSMGIQDGGLTGSSRRIDAVVAELAERDFLAKLREQHDLVIYRFDQFAAPSEIASFPRIARDTVTDRSNPADKVAAGLRDGRTIALLAGVILAIAAVSFGTYLFVGRRRGTSRLVHDGAHFHQPPMEENSSWSLLISMVALIAGLVVLSIASLRHPELEIGAILGWRLPAQVAATNQAGTGTEGQIVVPTVDWAGALNPRGVETRLGDAVQSLINKERGGPIAGIVVLTDGGRNAGSELPEIIVAARAAGIPIHAVGLGSDKRTTNVRVVDIELPPRVFPGDAFPITGYLQAFNLSGRSVKVELISSAGKSTDQDVEQTIEDTRQVTLAGDGELQPLRFEISPKQSGLRTYQIRVAPPPQDADDRDNSKSAGVQIVERDNRVLLFAGAATRDFQFLRNMLFRDKDTTVDVFLQTGVPGISQEADELLFEFPTLADEIFNYDAIVAFDPDWTKLDEGQVDLLERWVAEKAGGLVLVAGPVETPKLTSSRAGDSRLETIRGLYPVAFFSRGSATLSVSRTASETPWPLQFTRDGQESEFLRLEDEPLENERAWSSYSGVFGYFPIQDPKPGAKVFARFSDPSTALDGELPVYLAAQFYGAGRVFYQGSGEMWRLRGSGDAYFDRFYTKLIRWVSQGRLLRDSSRGLLLVDKDRCLLGDTLSVQAILSDSQHQPLTAGEVTAAFVHPDGHRSNLTMRRVADAARPGMYSAQFAATTEGDYRIELPLPNSSDGELLMREVRARIPALETERPERNDALLAELAEKTGGQYFIGFDAAMNRGGAGRAPLPALLEPQDQTTFLPGTPDRDFDRLLMTWLMAVICGALCLEWLLRRLNKLA